MKHRYWFLIIGLVVIFLILRHQITLQWPSSWGTKDPVYNTHPIFQANNLQNITGILLLWPHSSNRNKRSQSLSKNHEFLYGRIYDITYNSALNWFNKLNFPLQLIVENEKYQQYGNDFATLSAQLSGQNITLFKVFFFLSVSWCPKCHMSEMKKNKAIVCDSGRNMRLEFILGLIVTIHL